MVEAGLTNRALYDNILPGRARWGSGGALYPQSAIAGSNSPSRAHGWSGLPGQAAKKVGSCAAEAREPRQVREEATVSGNFWVPQGCLAGAGWLWQAGWYCSTGGARPALIPKLEYEPGDYAQLQLLFFAVVIRAEAAPMPPVLGSAARPADRSVVRE